jgi:hypothetical protein
MKILLKYWWLGVIIIIFGAGLYFGNDYQKAKQEVKDLSAEISKKDSVLILRNQQLEFFKKDTLLCKNQIKELQSLILKIRKDTDYWKDYAAKLESGEYCLEYYGWMKRKKRLVKCLLNDLP